MKLRISAICLSLALAGWNTAAAQKNNQWEQHVYDQIIEASRDLGVASRENGLSATVIEYFDGTIDSGEQNQVNIPVYPNRTYAIIAACDQDCTDIDLIVHEQNGNEVVADREIDDLPIVVFQTRSGYTYHFHAEMYQCSTSLCYYGAALYELN